MKKIFFVLCVLFSFCASAQRIQYVNTYGYEYQRILTDTLISIPTDTFPVPSSYNKRRFLATKANTLYLWDTTNLRWNAAAGGSGTGIDSIRYTRFEDSCFISTIYPSLEKDTVCISTGGIPTLQQVLDAGSTLTGVEGIIAENSFYFIADGTSAVLSLSQDNATTNDVTEILSVAHSTTGTAANNIGSAIGFYNEIDNGSVNITNRIISKWTIAANATRTARMILQGITNAGSLTDWLALDGSYAYLHLDTVATRAYARLVGGGGGGSGTVNSGTQYRLGYYATTGTAISEAAAITASRALISDANGVPTHSSVTSTELGYSSGVTSGIQGQIDARVSGPLSGGAGAIVTTTGTWSAASSNNFRYTSTAGTGLIELSDASFAELRQTVGSTDFRMGSSGTVGYIGTFSDVPLTIYRNNAERARINTSNNWEFDTKFAQYGNAAPTNGQLLIGHTSNGTFETGTITSTGSSITVTNGAGTINLETSLTLAAGTYTPTLTGVTNIGASTAYQCQYLRVGNTVTVSGKVDIDPTATGATELGLSLPIASGVSNDYTIGGAANSGAAAAESAAISGDSGNSRAAIKFIAVDISNKSYFFTFTYTITAP
jgi:hypothetical protein